MNEQDWDAVAARFEQEIFNVPASDRKGLIAAAVKRRAKSKGIAADIGCGIGRTVGLLAKHFGRVIASDVSRECLAIAAHKNRALQNVTYHHADLIAAPPPGPAADLALCINTLLIADLAHRLKMMEHICRGVKKGGHLLLVVPSIESALLTHHRRIQWNLRDGMTPRSAEKPRAGTVHDGNGLASGIVHIDKVPTKHFLKEELQDLLAQQGLMVVEAQKIEYPWNTEFEEPPRWMKEPWPWDWFLVAKKR